MVIAIALTVTGVMLVSKWAADRAARQASTKRLLATGELCINARYPLTSSVLTQIQELSGLRVGLFISLAETDQINLQSSSDTFPFSSESAYSLLPHGWARLKTLNRMSLNWIVLLWPLERASMQLRWQFQILIETQGSVFWSCLKIRTIRAPLRFRHMFFPWPQESVRRLPSL
jgi:hypothetical protein